MDFSNASVNEKVSSVHLSHPSVILYLISGKGREAEQYKTDSAYHKNSRKQPPPPAL